MIQNLSEPIKLKDLSDIAGVSQNQLIRDFKKVYGMTPMRFLLNCRLQYAKNLLDTTEMEITEIAFASGFMDSGYFSKMFRRKYGITPTDWKKNY